MQKVINKQFHESLLFGLLKVVQKVCLLNMGTADLYGSLDPFQRMPKSPRPDGSPSDYIQKVDLSNYW